MATILHRKRQQYEKDIEYCCVSQRNYMSLQTQQYVLANAYN